MDDTEALFRAAAEAVDGPWRPTAFVRLSMADAFQRAGLPNPLDFPAVDDLRVALQTRPVADDTWNDVFYRAFLDHVEGTLPKDRVLFLYGYPASMAALARLNPDDPRVAERFEVFVGDLELANAFGELTDPHEQRARFEQDRAERRRLGRPEYPIDEGLLTDLGSIGEASGIALGVDRLLMLCLQLPCIQDALPFSPRG